MKLFIVVALCASVFANPQGSTSGSSPGCSSNRTPYCCDIRATPQTPSKGCKNTDGAVSDVYSFFSGCANRSLQATCCTSVNQAPQATGLNTTTLAGVDTNAGQMTNLRATKSGRLNGLQTKTA
ncbi:uncharacterized protein RCC_07522 [Ramularia collo-cygni]|uniref:Hydrophobin n=1 Tax=Ramularia collo-cygni TaxID=112498 RepID=A0A2D3VA55_9PEZI|nr:uncharacterized protein RCC_07522 [Ramularia collo-cygni]CZT21657.1 uncharacterized protein RCC_07522 [Ramularia collo-cygni]